MLKILRFLVATSVTFVSSFLFFPTVGVTQEYAGCFMVNSSGKMVDLNNICINEKSVDQNDQLKPAATRNETNVVDDQQVRSDEKTISSPEELDNSKGKSVRPDGTIVYSNGIQARPDGTVIYSDGTQARPDGTIIYPDGRQLGPDD